MTRREYIPAMHDPILTELNTKWRRTDQEIADEMGFDKCIIGKHRARLNLPLNPRPKFTPHAPKEELRTATAKTKPNPLKVAKQWLDERLVEKPSGYWLDSVPVNLDAIMRATNRIIKSHGGQQCVHSEKWKVD
jgi:hypothetical protein